MKARAKIGVLTFIILIAFSCKDKSTGPENQLVSFNYLAMKCGSLGLSKGTVLDSIFTYTFTSTLVLDFSDWANCCAELVVGYAIAADTITILVADTARNHCRCICRHMIHVELAGLQRDHYVVLCKSGNEVLHLVHVYRKES